MEAGMKRTYLDAGVLVRAARGDEALSQPAIEMLCDPEREFVASPLVRMELLPLAQNPNEVAFYETYFKQVSIWTAIEPHLLTTAIEEVRQSKVGPLDAIQLVLAAAAGCHEFVTGDKPGAPIFSTQRVQVVGL
jgi:predicted nucleic acid-binding protein